jgi:penicillin-binding protein 1A
VLYDHGVGAQDKRPVIGQPALGYMIRMMRQVIASGTGIAARVPGYDLAGKTGTTSDYRDAWFIGYTGGFTTAVWLGKDDNTPMRRVTGGGPPAQIWRAYMTEALPRLKVQPIPGGDVAPPQPEPTDAIGAIINGVQDLLHGDRAELPAPAAPAPRDRFPDEAPH